MAQYDGDDGHQASADGMSAFASGMRVDWVCAVINPKPYEHVLPSGLEKGPAILIPPEFGGWVRGMEICWDLARQIRRLGRQSFRNLGLILEELMHGR